MIESMCGEKVRCVSKVSPSMVGVLFSGNRLLFHLIWGCFCDSLLSDVSKVTDDFVGEAVILFSSSHL